MTRELDITYSFKVGNVYLKRGNADGVVEFTTNAEDAYTVENRDVYNNEPVYHRHIKVINETIKKLHRIGFDNVKVIEKRVIVEIAEREREVELVVEGTTLKLKPINDDYRISDGLGDYTIGTGVILNGVVGLVKINEEN